MPDVTGMTEDEARRLISSAGLTFSFADPQGCDKLGDLCNKFEVGQVVSSSPRGGDRVERGTAVTIGVRAP
jgi:serine/threonine-protein kinase